VNPETIQKLKQEDRLEMEIEVPGAQLAPVVRSTGKKQKIDSSKSTVGAQDVRYVRKWRRGSM
jgi:hypothetical protein